MPQERQIVPVQLGGLGTSQDPRITANELLKCQNAVFPRKHAIAKRDGTKALTGTYTEQSMGAYRDRPVLYGTALRLFDGSAADAGSFVSAGSTPRTDIYPEPLFSIDGASALSQPTIGILGSVLAVGSYGNVRTLHRYSRTQLDTASADGTPQVLVVGTTLLVFDSVGYRTINTTTGVIGTRTAYPVASAYPNGLFDAVVMDSTTAMVVYVSGVALDTLQLGTWEAGVYNTTAFAKTYPIVNVAIYKQMSCTEQATAVCVYEQLHGDSTEEYFAEGYSKARVLTVTAASLLSLSSTATGTTMAGCATTGAAGKIYVTLCDSAFAHFIDGIWQVTFTDVAGTGTASGLAQFLKNVRVASKPFGPNTERMLVFFKGLTGAAGSVPPAQRTLFAVELPGGALAGKLLTDAVCTPDNPDLAYILYSSAPSHPQLIDGVCYLGASKLIGLTAAASSSMACACLVAATVGQQASQPVELGPYLLLPNSQPFIYDGVQVTEQGFACYPEGVRVSVGGTGGTIATGTYAIRVTYEWTDAQARRWRSAASPAVSFSITLGQKATYSIPILPLTNKTGVQLVIWRTKIGGSTYFERTYLNNNTLDADGVITYADGTPDSTAFPIGTRTLYCEEGGEIEATPPRPHRVAFQHQGRHFVLDRDEESTTWWYSKQLDDGVTVEHSDSLRLTMDKIGGRCTAAASFMGRGVIFKERAIYLFSGDGLDDLASGAGYSTPLILSPSVGCRHACTLVEIPAGLVFECDGDLYLLTRGLEVQPIGEPVREISSGVTIAKAIAVPDLQRAVFLTNGSALVYHYEQDRWSTWTAHEAVGGCWAGTRAYFVTSAGAVKVEDRGAYLDGTSPISMGIDTGWLSLAGLGGDARIKRALFIGYMLDRTAQLHVEWQYNGDPTWTDTQKLAPATLLNFDYTAHLGDGLGLAYTDQALALQAVPGAGRQRCTAVRLRIWDEYGGAGFTAVGLAFEVEPRPGAYRPGIARQAAP